MRELRKDWEYTAVSVNGRTLRIQSLIRLGWTAAIFWALAFGGSPVVAAQRRDMAAAEVIFRPAVGGESIAEVTASAPGSDWGHSGAEAAIATVYLDGHYNQDIVVDHGPAPFTYRVFFGPLAPGSHKLSIRRNGRWSAPHAPLRVEKVAVHTVSPSSSGFAALIHAPILYSRADTLGHFSDVPLLAWYEVFPTATGEEIQYSYIFSNEDAGTPVEALMARWGRATDIEYAYRVWLDRAGRIQRETFQGFEHGEIPFRGKKNGEHPYILVATPNNVFADTGFSVLQYHLLPVFANLSHHSREELMDRFPWTYRIMAEEMKHENKVRPFGSKSALTIGDPRDYLYIELDSDNKNGGLMVWVRIKGDTHLYASNDGIPDLAIWRSGWFRTTVELPPGTKEDSIQDVGLQCIAPSASDDLSTMASQCRVRHVSKAFLLDSDYRPQESILTTGSEVTLMPGKIYMLATHSRHSAAAAQ